MPVLLFLSGVCYYALGLDWPLPPIIKQYIPEAPNSPAGGSGPRQPTAQKMSNSQTKPKVFTVSVDYGQSTESFHQNERLNIANDFDYLLRPMTNGSGKRSRLMRVFKPKDSNGTAVTTEQLRIFIRKYDCRFAEIRELAAFAQTQTDMIEVGREIIAPGSITSLNQHWVVPFASYGVDGHIDIGMIQVAEDTVLSDDDRILAVCGTLKE